jgi:hypothetical protein
MADQVRDGFVTVSRRHRGWRATPRHSAPGNVRAIHDGRRDRDSAMVVVTETSGTQRLRVAVRGVFDRLSAP